MKTPTDIKALIGVFLKASHKTDTPQDLSDEIDLRQAGLIDSLGFARLLTDLERQLGEPLDLASIDPARLTHVGSLCRHIAAQLRLP